jgi:hypothetical protein
MSDRKHDDKIFFRMVILYVLLVFSVFLCMHGIDNAWNLKYMNMNYDQNLIGCAVSECYSVDRLYMKSLLEVEMGVFCVFVSSLVLGFYSARKI